MCTKEYNPSLGSWSVGEMFCLKLLPQFLSYLNETCYTWSLWLVYMHYILFLRPGQRVLKLWPLFELLQYSYNLHFLWQSGYRGLLITISESPSLCCACFDNWNSTDNATIFFYFFFYYIPPTPHTGWGCSQSLVVSTWKWCGSHLETVAIGWNLPPCFLCGPRSGEKWYAFWNFFFNVYIVSRQAKRDLL